MMLFRSARNADLEDVYALAQLSGIGITTLPKNKALLKKRLQLSSRSFKSDPHKPHHEYYFFVLEDPTNHKIVGTSAIEAKVGYDSPFYSYKISNRTRICHALSIRNDYGVLSLVNDHQGYSEICTLFLDPSYRHRHNGLLLSKGRFLFMAQFPQRFADHVIAEMRGVSDAQGKSPFWENLGRHFFLMSFVEADELTLSTDKQFIADLMPRHPVYIKLLSKEAQDAIGKPHETTLPAMKILLKEGFRYTQYVDIFDAGPTLEAPIEKINTFATSQVCRIEKISDEVSSKTYLLSNVKTDFRATIHHALIHSKDKSCIISKEAAQLLQVKVGECIRLAPL